MNPINTNSSLRRFQVIGFLSVLIMVGVVGSWSVLTELNGAVIAPATIMVETYSKKVQHKEGGIVAEIRVKDGDRVEIGQALVVLDNTETKSELAIMAGQTKLFNVRLQAIAGKKEQLNQQIGQLQEQIGGLESQRVSKEKQLT